MLLWKGDWATAPTRNGGLVPLNNALIRRIPESAMTKTHYAIGSSGTSYMAETVRSQAKTSGSGKGRKAIREIIRGTFTTNSISIPIVQDPLLNLYRGCDKGITSKCKPQRADFSELTH